MEPVRYQVLLLPRMEAAARFLSLREARAWIETYNAALHPPRPRVAIAEEKREEKEEVGRKMLIEE